MVKFAFWAVFILISEVWAVPKPKEEKSEQWVQKSEGSNYFCTGNGRSRQCVPRSCIENDENQQPGSSEAQEKNLEEVTGKLKCTAATAQGVHKDCAEAMKLACKEVMDEEGKEGALGKLMLGLEDQKATRRDRPNDEGTGCKGNTQPKIAGRKWSEITDQARGKYQTAKDKKTPNPCSQILNPSKDANGGEQDAGKMVCYEKTENNEWKAGLVVWYRCVEMENGASEKKILTDEAGEVGEEAEPDKDKNPPADEAQ